MSLLRKVGRPVDRWVKGVAAQSADQITTATVQTVRDEMKELQRMLRQQGDAADELAETFGRILTRLSGAVEELQARLDRLEQSDRSDRIEPGGR